MVLENCMYICKSGCPSLLTSFTKAIQNELKTLACHKTLQENSEENILTFDEHRWKTSH